MVNIQRKRLKMRNENFKRGKLNAAIDDNHSKEIKKSKDAEKEEEDTKKDGFGDDIEA